MTPESNNFKITAFNKDLIKWGPWSAVLITFVALISSAVLYLLIETLYNINSLSDSTYRSLPLVSFPFITALPIILIVSLFAAKKTGSFKKGLSALGLKKTSLPLSLMLVFFAFGLTMFIQIVIGLFIPSEQEVASEIQFGEGALTFLTFIGICLLVPFYEELLIRGLLFGGIRTRLSFLPAALISGIIFAVLHFEGGFLNIVAIFFVMILSSVVLSFLYEKTGSLYPPIALHALMNSTFFIFTALQ